MPFCGWAQISLAEQIENYHFVSQMSPFPSEANPVHSQPSCLTSLMEPCKKKCCHSSRQRPTEEENDKENVQKGPPWCWGPVWPRHESYHIQIIRETKVSITGSLPQVPCLQSEAYQKEAFLNKFWRAMAPARQDQIPGFCFLTQSKVSFATDPGHIGWIQQEINRVDRKRHLPCRKVLTLCNIQRRLDRGLRLVGSGKPEGFSISIFLPWPHYH